MKCAVHSEVDATGFCRNCGKALCPECTREVRGALYCESCLAGLVSAPVASPEAKSDVNPGLAAFLGFVPGLGAVYNGEYIKALIHVLIFAGIIALLNSDLSGGYDAFLGIALGCFYFYMPVEAYRTAKARRLGEPEPEGLVAGRSRKPIGALVLIGIGALLLLKNFGFLDTEWFAKAWPLGLIIIGGWLVWDRMQRKA